MQSLVRCNNDVFCKTQAQNVATESITPTNLKDLNLGGINDNDHELVSKSNVKNSHKNV